MPKERKTAEELDKLLHKEMELPGRDWRLAGDTQWLKVIPLEGDEWTNWTIDHGPEENPPGPFWRAIQEVLPGLQEKYDLKDTDGA